MKSIFKKIRIAGMSVVTLCLITSCSDLLDEQPRSFYDPNFFKTERGVEGGITSMYAHLRYIYGQAYFYNVCETGTDEVTYAKDADSAEFNLQMQQNSD